MLYKCFVFTGLDQIKVYTYVVQTVYICFHIEMNKHP